MYKRQVYIFTSVGFESAGASYKAGTFSVINENNVSLTGTGSEFKAGTFSNIINFSVSLTGAPARFGQDLRVWRQTTQPKKEFIWTLEN